MSHQVSASAHRAEARDFEAQSHEAQSAAKLSLGANVVLVAVKVGFGILSGSLSVLAEGVQSLVDILASAMILVSVRAATRPPDEEHPWGHGKFENLSSLVQMVLVIGSVVGIWWAAWHRWNDPVLPRADIGIVALLIAIAINGWVISRVSRTAKRTDSAALRAEVVHLRGDLWACAGVLGGLGATWISREPRLDPVFAAATALFAGWSALHLLRDTLRPLLDESLPGEEEQLIRQILESDARVLGFHKLRTRRAGNRRLGDVHILLDDELSFREAHRIAEEVEDRLRAALPNLDIVIHAEPFEEELAHQSEAH